MSGFRYYQHRRNTKWESTLDSDKIIDHLKRDGIQFLTILTLSETIKDGDVEDPSTIKYRGPLYFDIDFPKEQMSEAIASVNMLLDKLHDKGVKLDEIDVFASGSKGFHVIVPNKIFYSNRFVANLPRIYAAMVLNFSVPGLDFNVYKGGKGVSWRLPNIEREDTGTYRVLLPIQEVRELTPDKYDLAVKSPRGLETNIPVSPTVSPSMSTLFEEAKSTTTSRQHRTPISDAHLQFLQLSPPACLQAIVNGHELDKSANFNQVVLQFCIIARSIGIDRNQVTQLSEELAANLDSKKYDTVSARLSHIRDMIRYINVSHHQFSCHAVRKITGIDVCIGCGMNTSDKDSDDQTIIERPDGYYAQTGKDNYQKLTTFTMQLVSDRYCANQEEEESLREGVTVIATTMDGGTYRLQLHEDVWVSKAAFLRALMGRGSLACFATDVQIQKLKYYIFQQPREAVMRIDTLFSAGIHREEQDDKSDKLFYIEKGYCPDKDGTLNSLAQYELSGKIPAPPVFKDIAVLSYGTKKHRDFLSTLLQTNVPFKVGLIAGWYSACFLKQHLRTIGQPFPLLNLWGGAGAGKTTIATIWARLHSVDYVKNYAPVLVPVITPFALLTYLASTTTVVRVLDEYNKSKMRLPLYNTVTDCLKGAWDQQTISRGVVGRQAGQEQEHGRGRTSASTVEFPVSAPIVYLSEQLTEVPALLERSVTVNFDRGCHEDTKKEMLYISNTDQLPTLAEIGKMMMLYSLETTPAKVREMLNKTSEEVVAPMVSRKRHGYAVCLLGLDYLADIARVFEIDVLSTLRSIREETLEAINQVHLTDVSAASVRTEVDLMMDDICMMSTVRGSYGFKYLEEDRHYSINGDTIQMDIGPVFTQYLIYRKDIGNPHVALTSFHSMSILLKQATYFLWESMTEPLGGGKRRVVALSASKMSKAGIQVNMLGA